MRTVKQASPDRLWVTLMGLVLCAEDVLGARDAGTRRVVKKRLEVAVENAREVLAVPAPQTDGRVIAKEGERE